MPHIDSGQTFVVMIEYIKGELTELTPALAVVEAAGVGYALQISLNTYSAIQGKKDVKLYVHEAIVTGGRDDSFTLYEAGARALPDVDHREWGRGEHGAHDSVELVAEGVVQRHRQWRRTYSEGCEGHRPEDSPAHHRRPARQGDFIGCCQ